jgi:hypothetical protein
MPLTSRLHWGNLGCIFGIDNVNQHEYDGWYDCICMVASTKTADYPDGHAPNGWKQIKAKYQPDTGAELMQTMKEFYAMDMKEGQDPEIFITKLEYNRY